VDRSCGGVIPLISWSQLPSERPLVAPSLLSADFSRLGEEIAAVERGGADLLHLDVMDGHFVTNLTMGPVVIRGIRKLTKLFLDTHLMVVEPGRLVRDFRAAGADGITIHVEACKDVAATLAAVRETGARVGISLNPDTPVAALEPYLPAVDLVLVMSVYPGRGGQAFMPEALLKLKALLRLRAQHQLRFVLEVDGGIHPGTAAAVRAHGAEVLVAGSAVFGHPPYETPIRALRAAGAAPGLAP